MMGEAKRRRESAVPMVYHHTSTLRTNLIWMSGVIQLEGRSEERVFHPHLGEVLPGASLRRGFSDFPPLAWFTTRIDVPKCLQTTTMVFVSKDTGERREVQMDEKMSHGIALQRVALGFPVSAIPAVRWPDHYGYKTDEGRELNESARDVGDDPDDWYVSEQPVDVLWSTEVYTSQSILTPKLRRRDWYLRDVHHMVRTARVTPGFYIPPSWMKEADARALAASMGLKARWGSPSDPES